LKGISKKDIPSFIKEKLIAVYPLLASMQAPVYPLLGKGRLGGDDEVSSECRGIAKMRLINKVFIELQTACHPLLRLPFPRGGYWFAFQLL
jgi:hypothetical protein